MSVCKDFYCYNNVKGICLSNDKKCDGKTKCKFGKFDCKQCTYWPNKCEGGFEYGKIDNNRG